MLIQESGEMYLESILVITKEKGRARSVDVAEYLGVSKPSVSQAMSNLKALGFVVVEQDGSLVLTQSGFGTASKIYERHTVIAKMLERIGVSSSTASKDACRIEHVISDEAFEAIKVYTESNSL